MISRCIQPGVDIAGVTARYINKTSLIQPLPLSYRDRLLRIPGIKQVTFSELVLEASIKTKRIFFPQLPWT